MNSCLYIFNSEKLNSREVYYQRSDGEPEKGGIQLAKFLKEYGPNGKLFMEKVKGLKDGNILTDAKYEY
ncbi:hypothetical protein Syn6312_2825 [Synechococcus sp. PCC 6312]|nr:hypothetical protein Syn6312_2825 [Synechococcus sp. PCC 6312]